MWSASWLVEWSALMKIGRRLNIWGTAICPAVLKCPQLLRVKAQAIILPLLQKALFNENLQKLPSLKAKFWFCYSMGYNTKIFMFHILIAIAKLVIDHFIALNIMKSICMCQKELFCCFFHHILCGIACWSKKVNPSYILPINMDHWLYFNRIILHTTLLIFKDFKYMKCFWIFL